MEASRARNLVALGAVVAVGAVYYAVSERRTFAEDVRTICSAEARAETTVVHSRIVVESVARKNVRGDRGLALVDDLKGSAPDAAANQLRSAAASAGIAECPAIASYRALAARLELQKNAERMCSRLDPLILARLPRAQRFERLQEWTRANVAEPAVDDLLASAEKAPGTPAEKAARLRLALSDLGIHTCGVLGGLTSQLDPVPGPNVFVQSVGLQSDPREGAIAADLREKVPAFRQCYEAGLAKDAALMGTMNIKFRLTETGAIDFALAQDESTLKAPTVLACVVDAVKTAHGPASSAKSPGGIALVFWVAK